MSEETLSTAAETLDAERVRRPALHHVAVKTTRPQEMIDWYEKVIGTRLMYRFEGGAFLTNDEANHRIALFFGPALADDPERITRTGMHHWGFEYPHLDDLLATYVRLRDGGITPNGCLDHGPTTSFYYFDPDGNGVELQIDNHGDWARSSEFVLNDPRFRVDPVGKPVDPEQMVAAREAGESQEEIHRRTYRGEMLPSAPLDLRLPE